MGMDEQPCAPARTAQTIQEAKIRMYQAVHAAASRLGPLVVAGQLPADEMKAQLLRIADEQFARIRAQFPDPAEAGGATVGP
jgi:hypothetical protein